MCLIVLLGALLPRFTLALLLLLTEWTRVLAPWWLGILGFLFLPYTTLAYVVIHHYSGAVTTENIAHIIIMIIALITDLGAWGGGHRHFRKRD